LLAFAISLGQRPKPNDIGRRLWARWSCSQQFTIGTGGSTSNYMEAISAIESTTVSIVTHTPRKTQTLPAGPPLASEEALVL